MFGHKRHIDDSFKDLMLLIRDTGYNLPPAERQGVGSRQITSHEIKCDLRDGFPLLTTKRMAISQIFTELEWFIKGLTNIKWLRDRNCKIWDADAYKYYLRLCSQQEEEPFSEPEFLVLVDAGERSSLLEHHDGSAYDYGDLGQVYGAMWRNYPYFTNDVEGTCDQLNNLVHDIKSAISKGYNNRRMIVDAWHPFLSQRAALPPCHKSFQVILEPIEFNKEDYMSNGQWQTEPKYYLNLIWDQRSVDTFLGLPFNIASYALLALVIAKLTGTIAKDLTGQLKAVHIYDNHWEAVEKQLANEAQELPDISIGEFDELEEFMASNVMVMNYPENLPIIKAPMNS